MSDKIRIFISSANDDRKRMNLLDLDSQSRKIYLDVLMDGHERNFRDYTNEEIKKVILDIIDQCEVEEFFEQKKRLIHFFKKIIQNSDPKKIRKVYDALPMIFANVFFLIPLALDFLEGKRDLEKESDVIKNVVKKILKDRIQLEY